MVSLLSFLRNQVKILCIPASKTRVYLHVCQEIIFHHSKCYAKHPLWAVGKFFKPSRWIYSQNYCQQKQWMKERDLKSSKIPFLCPQLWKSGEHIAFGLSVRVCACVRPSVRSKKIKARVLKFHIWIPRQKIAYPYFFSYPNYLPLPSYGPFKG